MWKNGKKKSELLRSFGCLFLFLCFPPRKHSYSLKDQCPMGEGLAERFTIKHAVWEEPANRLPGKLDWSTTLTLRFEGLQNWGGGWEAGMVRNTKSEKSHQRGYHWSWNLKIHSQSYPDFGFPHWWHHYNSDCSGQNHKASWQCSQKYGLNPTASHYPASVCPSYRKLSAPLKTSLLCLTPSNGFHSTQSEANVLKMTPKSLVSSAPNLDLYCRCVALSGLFFPHISTWLTS